MSNTCMNHIEAYWKALTSSANVHFSKNNFEEALSGYKEALYRAEVLNNYRTESLRLNIPFMQVYVISCNNLSNTYLGLGQEQEAENMLKRAVYYLLHLSQQDLVNIEELQNELKRAFISLVSFVEMNGGGSKKEELLEIMKEQLREANLIGD